MANNNQIPVNRIDHVEVFVLDLDEAASWYEKTLGLATVEAYREWSVGDGPLMISADDGTTMVALFEGEPQGKTAPRGFSRLAFNTTAEGFLSFVERTQSELSVYDTEGKLLDGVEPVDHDLSFSVYFCDPYGNPLEVTTYQYDAVQTALENE